MVNELLTAFSPDATPARLAGLNRDMAGRIRYADRERVFALPARIRDYSPALTQAARNPGRSVSTPARMINRGAERPEADPPVMSKSEQRAARLLAGARLKPAHPNRGRPGWGRGARKIAP